jgi:hypothetical protein
VFVSRQGRGNYADYGLGPLCSVANNAVHGNETMDVGHGSSFYLNVSNIRYAPAQSPQTLSLRHHSPAPWQRPANFFFLWRFRSRFPHSGAEGENYFPRFSRQHCGGSNRNGVLFKQYSNVSTPHGCTSCPVYTL